MKRAFVVASAVLFLFLAASASAATFVVPADREMVRQSDAIVVGSVLGSYCQRTATGGIETVTTFSVEEVVKGSPSSAELEIHEPGGSIGDTATLIPGVPRFMDGERDILFLLRTP